MDWVQVHGKSMTPMLRQGDWVGLRWLDPSNHSHALKPGAILFFRDSRYSNSEWVVHRFIRRESDGTIILKGDFSRCFENIPASGVWASVEAIRKGRQTKERRFKVGMLDVAIARLSWESAQRKNFWGSCFKLVALCLAVLRKKLL